MFWFNPPTVAERLWQVAIVDKKWHFFFTDEPTGFDWLLL